MGSRASIAGPASLITLDTSAVVALADRKDRGHAACRDALAADPGPYFVPAGLLAEIGYMLGRAASSTPLDAFLLTIERSEVTLDCGDEDIPRVRELVSRYASLRLGIADACVVACAERNSGRVLTLDRRHFDVVSRDIALELLP